jgi:8-oxo-dGTP diphosphatase
VSRANFLAQPACAQRLGSSECGSRIQQSNSPLGDGAGVINCNRSGRYVILNGMKKLIKLSSASPWLPMPREERLYITDEMPPAELCSSAFGIAFSDNQVLLTRLKKKGWNFPGGRIDTGETPTQAAVREVFEETWSRVEVVELLGIQELEPLALGGDGQSPRPALTIQVFYLCRVKELLPFIASPESIARALFNPADARILPTIKKYTGIYEEALRRSVGSTNR